MPACVRVTAGARAEGEKTGWAMLSRRLALPCALPVGCYVPDDSETSRPPLSFCFIFADDFLQEMYLVPKALERASKQDPDESSREAGVPNPMLSHDKKLKVRTDPGDKMREMQW